MFKSSLNWRCISSRWGNWTITFANTLRIVYFPRNWLLKQIALQIRCSGGLLVFVRVCPWGFSFWYFFSPVLLTKNHQLNCLIPVYWGRIRRKWSWSFAQLIQSPLRLWRNPQLWGILDPAHQQQKSPSSSVPPCAPSSRSQHQPLPLFCAVQGGEEQSKSEEDAQGQGLSPVGQQWVPQQRGKGAAAPLRGWEELHQQKAAVVYSISSTSRQLGKGRRLTHFPERNMLQGEETWSPEQPWDMRAGSDLPVRAQKSSFPFWSTANEHLTEQFEANS